MRASAGVLVAIVAAGCDNHCWKETFDTPIPLRGDEMGRPCEPICLEAIEVGSVDFVSCRIGETEEGEPAAVCTFEHTVCPPEGPRFL